eukprot:3568952-Pyramimonas_sp.AAC.2
MGGSRARPPPNLLVPQPGSIRLARHADRRDGALDPEVQGRLVGPGQIFLQQGQGEGHGKER